MNLNPTLHSVIKDNLRLYLVAIFAFVIANFLTGCKDRADGTVNAGKHAMYCVNKHIMVTARESAADHRIVRHHGARHAGYTGSPCYGQGSQGRFP